MKVLASWLFGLITASTWFLTFLVPDYIGWNVQYSNSGPGPSPFVLLPILCTIGSGIMLFLTIVEGIQKENRK